MEQQEDPEFMPLTDSSGVSQQKHEALMTQLDAQKKAKTLQIPTEDKEVKYKLRAIGEPVCLFGEGPAERRDRLRFFLSNLDEKEAIKVLTAKASVHEKVVTTSKREIFYTEGSKELKKIREWLITYSIPRSQYRLVHTQAKRKRDESDADREAEDAQDKYYEESDKALRDFGLVGTVRGDERPLSSVKYTPDGKHLLTSSWTGQAKVWEADTQKHVMTLRGHKDRCNDVIVTPNTAPKRMFATSSADKTVRLYGEDGVSVSTLEGHLARVNRLDFHPSGRLLASASHDASWKLWDVERGTELMDQEGHSRAVHDVKFDTDGGLAVSVGYDVYGRLWDLRTGSNIMVFDGHVKPVVSASFHPNGGYIITGSEDHTAKVWDLRKRRCMYTILAHSAMITNVSYFPSDPVWFTKGEVSSDVFSSEFLLTSSIDGTCKVWSGRDFSHVKTLATPGEKIMSADVNTKLGQIATAHYDRNLRVWGPEGYA
uniref:Pre-mRNA processing factor 4 (PRP4)-like domain-containing protein n=1 Tax=Palpitomonas bilix TaxID=652834 RepID=A0A7S3DHD5_9EUKA